MSSEITTAFVQQYSANIFHLSQQKGSRMQAYVRNEQQRGKSAFYDRLGDVAAQKITSRHSDTQYTDTPHSRRRVTLVDYDRADLIDDLDKVRMLIDPTSAYTQSFVWALGRAKDDELIEKALGNAQGGEEGSTAVAHPNSQKRACVNDAANAGANLNVEGLRRVKEVFDSNDVDEDIMRCGAISSSGLQSLLAETEVTSADFNTVRALVDGKVDTFMGFKMIRTERLDTQSGSLSFSYTDGTVGSGSGDADGYRRNIFWAMDGLLLATAKEVNATIDRMPNKRNATQVYASLSIGATRMEEEKVVELLSSEA